MMADHRILPFKDCAESEPMNHDPGRTHPEKEYFVHPSLSFQEAAVVLGPVLKSEANARLPGPQLRHLSIRRRCALS